MRGRRSVRVKSDAATVDDFLAEQPENLRDALAQIRHMIRMELPDAVEAMHYRVPMYHLSGGTILCGFTAHKHNLAFYVGRVADELRERMIQADFSLAKGADASSSLTPRSCSSCAACCAT